MAALVPVEGGGADDFLDQAAAAQRGYRFDAPWMVGDAAACVTSKLRLRAAGSAIQSVKFQGGSWRTRPSLPELTISRMRAIGRS